MKKYILILTAFIVFFIHNSNATEKVSSPKNLNFEVTEKKLDDSLFVLVKKADSINALGGFAAVGTGKSSNIMISFEKSRSDALREISLIVSERFSSISANFIKELKPEIESQVKKALSTAVASTARELNGILTINTKLSDNTNTSGFFVRYTLVKIDNPNFCFKAFKANLEKIDKATYNLFLSSKTFKEYFSEVAEK